MVWGKFPPPRYDRLAMGTLAGAVVASDLGKSNLVTNGGFEVWQRGTGPFTAHTAFTADRWQISLGGTSTLSVSKDTTNVAVGSGAAVALTYTHNAASYLYQTIEDSKQLRGQNIAFSAKVRGTVASSARLRLYDGATFWFSPYHSGSGAYETLSVVGPFAAGATAAQVALELNVSGTYYLDNAMLVVGTQYQDYQPLTPADDLARCQRYYETAGGSTNYQERVYISDPVNWGWASARPWQVRKAVTPTVTKSGAWTQDGSATGVPAFAAYANGTEGYLLYIAPTGGATAGVVRFYATDATGLIIAEANP